MRPSGDGPVTADGSAARPESTWAWVLAWIPVGGASIAAFELAVPWRADQVGVRIGLHLHALGLGIGLALLGALLTDGVRRVRRGAVRVAVVAVVAAGLGVAIVEEDARGIAESLPGPGGVWSSLLGAAVGMGAAAGFLVGAHAGRRPATRAAAVLLGLVAAVLHHRALESGYEGVHLATMVGCASLVAGALETSVRRRAPTGRAAVLAAAGLAVVGAAALTVDPGSDVVLLAKSLPGHSAPSLAARARRALRPQTFVQDQDSPWLRPRTTPVPPSAPRPPEEVRNVVLLIVDTMRFDLVDGASAARFPNFQRLARSSIAFTHARSVAPHTTPAIASLMTGKYYSQLVWSYRDRKRPRPYTDTSPTLGEELEKGGWSSVGYVSLEQLADPDQKLTRGFTEGASNVGSAPKIVEKVRRRLKARPRDGEGLFVYAHVKEPHHPYQGDGDDPFERYLGDVAEVDAAIGPLLDDILTGPLADTTALIVTADHGEAFGEHGTKQHGATVYDELMRVPMYVRIPGVGGRRSDAPVTLIDLTPTILDLARVPSPPSFMGESILPIVTGRAEALERPLFIESGRLMRAYIEEGRWKLIHDVRRGTHELYDLDGDPAEMTNLFAVERKRAERMAGFTEQFFAVHGHRAPGYEVPYIP